LVLRITGELTAVIYPASHPLSLFATPATRGCVQGEFIGNHKSHDKTLSIARSESTFIVVETGRKSGRAAGEFRLSLKTYSAFGTPVIAELIADSHGNRSACASFHPRLQKNRFPGRSLRFMLFCLLMGINQVQGTVIAFFSVFSRQ